MCQFYPNFFYSGSSRPSLSKRANSTFKRKNLKFLCAEKHRKKRWLFKKLQEKFKKNPYQAGKELLDSKSDAKLTFDQLTLDRFKSASVEDKFYDVNGRTAIFS